MTLLALVAGGYGFVKAGGIPMETTAAPLPLERTLARLAIRASIGRAAEIKDRLVLNEANAGADLE